MEEKKLKTAYVTGPAYPQNPSGAQSVREEMRRAFGIPENMVSRTIAPAPPDTPLDVVLQSTDRGPHTGYKSASAVLERTEPPMPAIPWLA